jgi:MFS family permease
VVVTSDRTAAQQLAVVPLRRNWRFQLLWVGSSVAFLGMRVTDVAYPLAILTLTGSPGQAALFGFVQTLSNLTLSVPAGEIVDRFDRRMVLLGSETVRMLAATSVAIVVALDRLTMPHLLVVAATLGAGAACAAPARMLVVRALVPPQQLTAALTQEEVRQGTAALAGPPLGGVLFAARQALPFVFSAAAFAASLLCALIVRLPPRTGTAKPNRSDAGPFSGIRTLLGDPVLRAATLLIALLNTVGAPLPLVAIVILQSQQASAQATGLAMTGLAVGMLCGAPLVKPLHRALRPGPLLITVFLIEVPVLASLGLPWGPWWVGGLLIIGGLGIPSLRVLIDVLIFRQVPDERRGRVIASAMTLLTLGAPIGAGTAGLLLEYLQPAGATMALAGLLAAGGAYALSHSALRSAEWPMQSAPTSRS